MDKYVGTKVIMAKPMTRQEYNDYRGWKLSDDEQHLADEEGMLVEYEDTGHPNVEGHAGYVSWSPLGVFAEAYQANGNLSFGSALELLKRGHKVARNGWNGKGMYLYLVPSNTYESITAVAKAEHGSTFEAGAYITMKPAQGPMVIGWLASQTDMLTNDWMVVE